jgi:hypothetical protein
LAFTAFAMAFKPSDILAERIGQLQAETGVKEGCSSASFAPDPKAKVHGVVFGT